MYKVGITGGIGSGKSTVCKFFTVLNIPVFIADMAAKEVMNSSQHIRNQLISQFGEDIYVSDGYLLDRRKLAELIFNSPALLEKVASIVHPEVRNYFINWVAKQNSPYVVYEAAILFESGFYSSMDYNILVTAPAAERIKRVMAREEITEQEIQNRMSKQWPDNDKIQLADYILNNDNKELIIPQLMELDKKFRAHG